MKLSIDTILNSLSKYSDQVICERDADAFVDFVIDKFVKDSTLLENPLDWPLYSEMFYTELNKSK